jgi:hypothetical protein
MEQSIRPVTIFSDWNVPWPAVALADQPIQMLAPGKIGTSTAVASTQGQRRFNATSISGGFGHRTIAQVWCHRGLCVSPPSATQYTRNAEARCPG